MDSRVYTKDYKVVFIDWAGNTLAYYTNPYPNSYTYLQDLGREEEKEEGLSVLSGLALLL